MIRMDEVEPTCTESGKKQYYYCASCDLISSDSKGSKPIDDADSLIIPAEGHKDSKWKSNDEVHWKECTVKGCGEITVTEESHDFNKSGKCTVCGYKKADEADTDDTNDIAGPDDTTTADNGGEDTAPTTDVTAPEASGNTVMWIAIIASGVIAVAAIIVVVAVLKKSKK